MARAIAQNNPPAVERVGLARVGLAEFLHVRPRNGAVLRSGPGVRCRAGGPYIVSHRLDEAQRVVGVLRLRHAK